MSVPKVVTLGAKRYDLHDMPAELRAMADWIEKGDRVTGAALVASINDGSMFRLYRWDSDGGAVALVGALTVTANRIVLNELLEVDEKKED